MLLPEISRNSTHYNYEGWKSETLNKTTWWKEWRWKNETGRSLSVHSYVILKTFNERRNDGMKYVYLEGVSCSRIIYKYTTYTHTFCLRILNC